MAQAVQTDRAPQPIGPYSQGICAGSELYCSGQIALDPQTGELNGHTAAEQAEQAFKNLRAVLEAAGLGCADVVKTTLYLTDMEDFTEVNRVYARYFDLSKPARSTVAVRALPKGSLVEIDAIARKNQ
jgi:2-iminobutanoate/2-iminopropanoate deaminase